MTAGVDLRREALRHGVSVSGWDADWTGLRLWLAGFDQERDASLGGL
ncbi:hypothetical protein [Sphingobium baderi]|nr:hypothetical protein [Sphingobium baderi]